jgi:hypothetical protein
MALHYYCILGEAFLNESRSDIGSLKSSMESLFDGNYNETWNATLNQFDAFVANLSFYLSCFESDKFVGKHIYKYSIVRNKRRSSVYSEL